MDLTGLEVMQMQDKPKLVAKVNFAHLFPGLTESLGLPLWISAVIQSDGNDFCIIVYG